MPSTENGVGTPAAVAAGGNFVPGSGAMGENRAAIRSWEISFVIAAVLPKHHNQLFRSEVYVCIR